MKKIALFFALILFIFSSCNKDLETVTPESPTMKDLKVTGTFDWKTTRNIEITVKGFVNGIVEVVSAQGTVYQKAFIMQNQPYTMNITIPSYETELYLKYLGSNVKVEPGSGKITHVFVKP